MQTMVNRQMTGRTQSSTTGRASFGWGSVLIAAALLVLSLVSGVAQAQSDAYSVEVAVADRGADEQEEAYIAALRRVLLSNSGDKTLLNRDAIREGLRNARDYVTSFSYRMPPAGTVISTETPITDEVRRTGQATQLMMVSFDRDMVRQLIDESAPGRSTDAGDGIPAAAPRSNSALVWLLIQDDGRDIMISDPAAVNVRGRAKEIAGAQGMALVYPAGDDQDRAAVTTEDMLARDLGRIMAASVRYEQDTVLIGTLVRNGSQGWLGDWARLQGDEVKEASFENSSLDEALQDGLLILGSDGGLDESYRYGGSATSDTEALVWVGSVNSIDDYASMMNFFQSLPAVSTVYPKEVTDTSVVFAVLPRSALNDIDSALASQSRLRRTAPPVTNRADALSRRVDLSLEFGG